MTEYRHTVQYYETDKMAVTHHSNYIRWMEEARIDFLKQIGWAFDKLEAQGIISPVVDAEGRMIRMARQFPEFHQVLLDLVEA